jgi:hypothetical protein
MDKKVPTNRKSNLLVNICFNKLEPLPCWILLLHVESSPPQMHFLATIFSANEGSKCKHRYFPLWSLAAQWSLLVGIGSQVLSAREQSGARSGSRQPAISWGHSPVSFSLSGPSFPSWSHRDRALQMPGRICSPFPSATQGPLCAFDFGSAWQRFFFFFN